MLIVNNEKYIESRFRNEKEIEDLVINNYQHFFGPSSFLIPKTKISTIDGFKTVPDGFAIDLATRTWYIVEAETSDHNVWSHIAPQITKQITATLRKETKEKIIELIIHFIQSDPKINDLFIEEDIKEINIRRELADIFNKAPVIGIPIDVISNDLEQWAGTLRNDVRLWLVKKYVGFDNASRVIYSIPEEFRPTIDTIESVVERRTGIRTYDVRILDLLENGWLTSGDTLILNYKKKKYKAIIDNEGRLQIFDQVFDSPSYAALFCIKHAGATRETINGWKNWKTEKNISLAKLRDRFLEQKEKSSDQ